MCILRNELQIQGEKGNLIKNELRILSQTEFIFNF